MRTYSKLFFCIVCLTFFSTSAQVVDMINAPRNPIGYKHKKEHFNLKGDIYSSAEKIFDRDGKLLYNYGTRYYYNNQGKIIGNNYNDTFSYDNRGRIIMFMYHSGSKNTYAFNDKNLLTYETNTYGEDKTYVYDSQNRIIKTIVNRNDVFYQEIDYTYSKIGNTLIVSLQYTNQDRKPGSNFTYHYENGYIVKEILLSGTYTYKIEVDGKGNQVDFYETSKANPKHFDTQNRYYSDINKPTKIELGYFLSGTGDTATKITTAYLNGEKATDIVISKGVKPNEKVLYDGLTETYYSIPDVIEENHTIETRIAGNTVLSKGRPYMSYSYDGMFINYVYGQNSVKSREFSFLGPHMVDYRIEKNVGRTYVVKNYQNIKDQEVKEMNLFTTDTTSVLYTRELEKDNFFIVVKGKHIDYKKAKFEYLTNGDPVIFIDDKPMYVLLGFKTAKDDEIYEGKVYDNELETQKNSETTTSTTNGISDYKCVEGDCKEGWGRVTVNKIITDATFRNSAIDGLAYITYPNGSYYHGQYVNNRREGIGYYVWPNGNSYIGGWKDGKQHGLGYTSNKGGAITSGGLFEDGILISDYTEDFRAGKKNGNCIGNCTEGFGNYTYSNGDKYWGFFKENQRYGVGTYYWSNTSKYTGAYILGGKRSGYGIYTYVDGSIFKGLFIDDKINGLGQMTYNKTGHIAKGVFDNNGAKVKDY
ncbi:MORN repeat-containing protein [Psychroserpens sp. Hel_I_66]|uniref:MORN repeat-containing protein n=1 Tax=Psychroserpens sp. Hel_I_66 TaxID=1250004 RepID=UPI000646FB05|nr:MORN motif precursor [Psychroserpens sp. Hel_I_66]